MTDPRELVKLEPGAVVPEKPARGSWWLLILNGKMQVAWISPGSPSGIARAICVSGCRIVDHPDNDPEAVQAVLAEVEKLMGGE